uniref:Hexosyltransferase n=1 Tax=Lotharella oceanica TaxID=641309 RepID=A0A7S2XG99_9EUKA|mmetsp:Transcript_65/g.150  ORF Transcript_65/g.150 Transcript_65/m.150 type:complete len:319 (+) Transcript_65:72-1028(+)
MQLASRVFLLHALGSCLAAWSAFKGSSDPRALDADNAGKPLDGYFFGVMTAPDNFAARDAIRKGWIKNFVRQGASYRFFIGSEGLDEAHVRKINAAEDVVGLPFVDSYMNLTRKTMAAANWTASNLENLQYFIKIDDDVYPCVEEFKRGAATFKPERFYGGRKMENFKVMTEGTWALPEKYWSMFPEGIYPTYAEGPMYVLSGDLLRHLGAQFEPALSDEDVFPFEDINTGVYLNEKNIQVIEPSTETTCYILSHHYKRGEDSNWYDTHCSKNYRAYHTLSPTFLVEAATAEEAAGTEGVKRLVCKSQMFRAGAWVDF